MRISKDLPLLPDANKEVDAIHQIIDKAIPRSIASSGVMGHTVRYDSNKVSWSKRKEVDRFLHLFNSQTEDQRMVIMWQMFSPSEQDDIDNNLLRAWLKEVAEIMEWKDEGEVRLLLGVAVSDHAAEARRKEQDAKANALMDELDVAMGTSPPTNEGPRRTPSPSPPPKPLSPSASDVSRSYYDVEEGQDRAT